ncbi:MAG: cation-translocating P-type ATPase [Candidatus Thorarchaeota archaeon]|nr:cation-translocating P-type ATPase [Candidatus Thorarchaeota archaeon]
MEENWHAMDAESVLHIVGSSPEGLTSEEAKARIVQSGPNELAVSAGNSVLGLFLGQFKNILTIILILAAIVSIVVDEVVDAILILIIVFVSALLGFSQEYRAEKALDALRQMLRPTAVVLRDGRPTTVLTREIVPGDILILKEGERLPADGRVIESVNLKIGEAAITGESVPVQKTTATLPIDTPLGDRRNIVLSGTDVTYGKGMAVVVATGLKTEFGRIASQVASVRKESTPLEIRTREIGVWLGTVCLVVCAVVVVFGLLEHFFLSGSLTPDFIRTMFLFGIALAVASVPEALPGVVAGSLAIGMHRMAHENALVRRMAAVETLGCTSVICSDKTGTITRGEMTVRQGYVDDVLLAVSGEGYEPVGEILPMDGKPSPVGEDHFRMLMEGCALCNDATVERVDGRWKVMGDPTEGALLVLSMKAHTDVIQLRERCARIGEIPFSSERKRMSTIHDTPSGSKILYMKGAAEIVLERCAHYATASGVQELTNEVKLSLLERNSQMASQALRVLAVAYTPNPNMDASDEDAVERDLTFLGLVGMIDPARQDAIQAIGVCTSVGIRPVMITGDHKLTAVAVAKEVGIYKPGDLVLTDSELGSLTDQEYDKIVDQVTVYARVSPSSKLRIIQAWKRRGKVVAMTGDGVNDAPALKQADIGVAMGITGTDVTKEASDLVLADDNFATIEKAIELGRWIYDNIKKYLAYLLQANLVEIIVLSLAVFMGYPLPLLPAHVLYINLATDGLPAIALGLSPPDQDIMKKPPRNPRESIFSRDVKEFYLITVLVQVPLFLLIFMGIAPPGTAEDAPAFERARTVLFFLFVFFELTLSLTCRSLRQPLWRALPHKMLLASVIFNALLTIILFGMVPGVAAAFALVPLDVVDVFVIAGMCVLTLLIVEAFKAFLRWQESHGSRAD